MKNKIFNLIYHNKIINWIFPTLYSLIQRELCDCESVLDLGCGPSSPVKHVKNLKVSVGVEIFDKYIEESKRKKIHKKYIKEDILRVKFPKNSFDAVIMIEVLEHLSHKDGIKIIKRAERWAKKKVIISSPNGFIPQKEVDNNPWQTHLSGWSYNKMKRLGFVSFGLAGIKSLRQEVKCDIMGDNLTSSMRYWPQPFWFFVATLSQSVTYRYPKIAFELFSVKLVDKGKS